MSDSAQRSISDELIKITALLEKHKPQQMAIAMADKTFVVHYTNGTIIQYNGTLELEGSFAVIREWKKVDDGSRDKFGQKKLTNVLTSIKVIPAERIIDINWKAS